MGQELGLLVGPREDLLHRWYVVGDRVANAYPEAGIVVEGVGGIPTKAPVGARLLEAHGGAEPGSRVIQRPVDRAPEIVQTERFDSGRIHGRSLAPAIETAARVRVSSRLLSGRSCAPRWPI